jgi:hypothetical protein
MIATLANHKKILDKKKKLGYCGVVCFIGGIQNKATLLLLLLLIFFFWHK